MATPDIQSIADDLLKSNMEKCYENYILIDVGANLTNKKYGRDLDSVVQRAKDSGKCLVCWRTLIIENYIVGVQKIMVTGTSVKGSKEALRLTRIYPGTLYSTAGFWSKQFVRNYKYFLFTLKAFTHMMPNPMMSSLGKNWSR